MNVARQFLLSLTFAACLSAAQQATVRGTVTDPTGAVLPGVRVVVESIRGTVIRETATGPDGRYLLSGLPPGAHLLRAQARNFDAREVPLALEAGAAVTLDLRLELSAHSSQVTVTGYLGGVEEVQQAPRITTVRSRAELLQQPRPTIGNALEGAPGILVQQTTYAQVSPVLRGLTGYETLLLVDGIRYNTSIFRSGPNQYLSFVDATQARAIEATLGPSSSQYGSDSLGGTINVRTLEPSFRAGRRELHGEANLFAASTDLSTGSDFLASLGNQRVSWLFGGYGRRHNDLRGGRGGDSHNAFTRFFGLSGEQVRDLLGPRMQDTGFSQLGFENMVALRVTPSQSLRLRHQYSDARNVRSYRDQLGGVGRLEALLSPQRLNFGYGRYEKLGLGPLDSLSGTFSVNSQIDGYTRQNLRVTDAVICDRARVDAYGFAGQAQTHAGRRAILVAGADSYRELVYSTRFTTSPVSGLTTQGRAQFPNGSRYVTSGVFAESTLEILPGKLRSVTGARLTRVAFATRADRNLGLDGRPLGVTDSLQTFQYYSFNTSLVYWFTPAWSLNGLVGRGIRAPNVTDLSSIGLTTLGFDVTAADAAAAGAWIGSDGGEGSLATDQQYSRLRAETLTNYELGLRFQSQRLYARVQAFDAEVRDPLVGRTLVFPLGRVPTSIAGYPVAALPQTAAQARDGVVAVATALAPRAVRSIANAGALKYYGAETLLGWKPTYRWSLEGNYALLAGRELRPNRPIRRLPPQQLQGRIRYARPSRIWLEALATFSGSQYRMNPGDYDDDRMGAARRRSDITDFFRGGFAAPYIIAGPDGSLGTPDDLFVPTGETLAQIRDRVLPLGQVIHGVRVANDGTRVPLFAGTDGWWVFGVRGGIPLGERLVLNWSLMNLADRNYRVHGSGTDAPGRNATLSLRYVF